MNPTALLLLTSTPAEYDILNRLCFPTQLPFPVPNLALDLPRFLLLTQYFCIGFLLSFSKCDFLFSHNIFCA
jgi:hypothetical protein